MTPKFKVFHGGCLLCTSQRDTGGIERCKGCMYYEFSDKLPSLATEDRHFRLAQWVREQEYLEANSTKITMIEVGGGTAQEEKKKNQGIRFIRGTVVQAD